MDATERKLFDRIAVALERIADHLAPVIENRERKPATWTTASYTREERDKKEVRATLRGEKPLPPGRTPETS